jgi:hypothetical protein
MCRSTEYYGGRTLYTMTALYTYGGMQGLVEVRNDVVHILQSH